MLTTEIVQAEVQGHMQITQGMDNEEDTNHTLQTLQD